MVISRFDWVSYYFFWGGLSSGYRGAIPVSVFWAVNNYMGISEQRKVPIRLSWLQSGE